MRMDPTTSTRNPTTTTSLPLDVLLVPPGLVTSTEAPRIGADIPASEDATGSAAAWGPDVVVTAAIRPPVDCALAELPGFDIALEPRKACDEAPLDNAAVACNVPALLDAVTVGEEVGTDLTAA
ncbi:hypothetical protein Vafri_13460 [Volvox africanus]|nr:hypothetical protein Vafri_13460 [Volvox africanus]